MKYLQIYGIILQPLKIGEWINVRNYITQENFNYVLF